VRKQHTFARRKARLLDGASYSCFMEIHSFARKHGIADADTEHAVDHPMAIKYQDDGALLCLGPSRSGTPLEVIKVVRDGLEVIIHAMPIRDKHKRLLPGYRARR
jgi:hypothetical protein